MLADDIKSRRWVTTPDAVGLDRNGIVVNGQHRLLGVLSSGVAVPMLVGFGFDPAVYPLCDTGQTRTFADVLAHEGTEHAKVAASISGRVHLYASKGARRLTRAELQEWHQSNMDQSILRRAAEAGKALARKDGLTASFVGTVFYLTVSAGHDDEDVTRWLRRVQDNDGIDKKTGAWCLRSLLNDSQKRRLMNAGTDGVVRGMALCVKAFNADYAGQQMSVLKFLPTEELPPVEPALSMAVA
jgi:hypothetical protein